MAIPISSKYTLLPTLYFLLISSSSSALNITDLLSPYPDLSTFSSLLSSTPSLLSDLSSRSSLTLLVVPNSRLPNPLPSPSSLPDILRYHILLQYLSLDSLLLFPPSGKLIPTLFQTTGRASSPNSGSLNISHTLSSNSISFHSPSSNASLLSPIKTLPYNLSILSLDSLLLPYNLDLMASETRPPLGLNITKALSDGHNFNVAASMLAASGVESEFEADEGGAGITLFIPTDEAFSDLPSSVRFQSLPADKKAVVLRFHVLHSYYPLGSLESIVNPVQPTLATEQNGAGSFTLNISRVNGSVAIDTGLVQASVTQTVFDQNPVAIFGVSRVLLPREYFGKNGVEGSGGGGGGGMSTAEAPEINAVSPNAPPSTHLSAAPPGMEMRSGAAAEAVVVVRIVLGLWCVGLGYWMV